MKDTDFNLAKNIKETQSAKEKEAEIIIDEYDEEDDYEETKSAAEKYAHPANSAKTPEAADHSATAANLCRTHEAPASESAQSKTQTYTPR